MKSDFYRDINSTYLQALSLNVTSNLDVNKWYYKIKNVDWHKITVSENIGDDFVAEVKLIAGFTSFSSDVSEVIFSIKSAKNDTKLPIREVLEVITKDQIIEIAKRLGAEFIEQFNAEGYQVIGFDKEIATKRLDGHMILVPIFDLETGKYVEPEEIKPTTIQLTLDM